MVTRTRSWAAHTARSVDSMVDALGGIDVPPANPLAKPEGRRAGSSLIAAVGRGALGGGDDHKDHLQWRAQR